MSGSKRTRMFGSETARDTFQIRPAAVVRTYKCARRNPCLTCGRDYETSCGTIRSTVYQFAPET